MEDDPKQIEHDPDETAPNRKYEYDIDPWWVVGITATLAGIYFVNFGLPNHDPVDMAAFVLFGAFCAWNYWPRKRR